LPNGDFVLSTGKWYFLPMKNLSLNFLPNQNFPCPWNRPSICPAGERLLQSSLTEIEQEEKAIMKGQAKVCKNARTY